MPEHKPLKLEKLYRICDPAQFTFATTADLSDLEQLVGQNRALQAVEFGAGIRRDGYNLFVMGPHGMGKHTLVRQVLEQRLTQQAAPHDICYVNNFAEPHMPSVMTLPAGKGKLLSNDMTALVENLRSSIPAAFESEEYRHQIQLLEDEIKQEEEDAFVALQQESMEKKVKLFRTPSGFTFAPLVNGKVIGPNEFQELDKKERKAIENKVESLQEKLQDLIRHIEDLKKETRKKVKSLNSEVTMFAVGNSISELEKRYQDLPEALDYLKAVQQDVIDNAGDFRPQEEQPALLMPEESRPSFKRYNINVLVDHTNATGAPLIYEDFPTFTNIMGRVEHTAHLGTLLTDFTLIKSGALHRANGGYLVLDAHKVLTQPFVWDGLKRALRSHHVNITSPSELYGLVSTVSLQPEPMPLDIKIVLVGERLIYYLLCELDPEFDELFKVAADFDDEVDWNTENTQLYAQLIATLVRKEKLQPLDPGGVARVIEESARMVEDAEKFSTQIRQINDLLKEADYWATERGTEIIQVEDIQKALDMQFHRASRYHERMLEEIRRGTVLIEIQGSRCGTVNALTIIQLGEFSFGQPARITATIRLGDGEVIDIEREVDLGGAIHSKGIMILSAYLSSCYAKNHPLSLNASLVFEQSYGQVDGDSASVAELCSLLSAIAEVPINQAIAITGSVNQLGQAQVIGGVNEKIEGFFRVCQQRGLTGEQGVIIPASNAKHLMLHSDILEAVSQGKFNIYPMESVDDAMEILTGVKAGTRDAEGLYPEDSINRKVEDRLHDMAHIKHTYNGKHKHKEDEDETEEGTKADNKDS